MLKNKRGVSLAEMIAVIAISGIVASLVSLFVIQASRTIATHKENNSMIFETSLIFKELEKNIQTYDPVSTDITFSGNNVTNILVGEIVIFNLEEDLMNPGCVKININNVTFPSDPNFLITAATMTKDPLENEKYELYNFNIVTKTKDTDSVPLTKNYTTSFLIKK